MEAVLSAGFIPKGSGSAALMALDHEARRFIDVAIPSTLKGLRSHWEPAIEKGELDFARVGHREFAEQFAGIGIDKRLIALIGNPNPHRSEISAVKRQFVSTPSDKLVSLVVNAVGKNAVQSDLVSLELLDALRIVGDRSELEASREFATLLPALAHSNDGVVVNAASSFGSWQVSSAGPKLLELLRDRDRTPEIRRAAAIALGDLGRTKYINALKALASVSDIATRYHAVTGLVAGDLEAKAMVEEVLTQKPLDADPVTLVTGSQRHEGDTVLADCSSVAIHPEVKKSVSTYHDRLDNCRRNSWACLAIAPKIR